MTRFSRFSTRQTDSLKTNEDRERNNTLRLRLSLRRRSLMVRIKMIHLIGQTKNR